MHSSLGHTTHRPWPLPDEEWTWKQSWLHLAFIHYPIDANAVQARIPTNLRVQEFDGTAWVGIVPFLMCDVRRGNLPSFSTLGAFPEVNLRTYVECNGRPGVWFFSLDADSWPVVLGGRVLYGAPYFKASMSHTLEGAGFRIESVRARDGTCFRATCLPVGPAFRSRPGSFEHWMAERYCLYSRVRGATICTDVHHRPWPLQAADIQVHQSDLMAAEGLMAGEGAPRCHFSSGVEVVSYAPYRTDKFLEQALLPITGQAGHASLHAAQRPAPVAWANDEPRARTA